jgi:tetratricopeptide (TPR) repeat protein
MVLALEGKLTEYEVDPAVEYRTLAHVSSEPIDYRSASIHRDGRLLAVGTNQGVAIWDLAHDRELAFLPIGPASQVLFEASGDLVTSGKIGARRWPCRLDLDRREFHIGPPTQLPLPAADCGIAEDRAGRIMAWADRDLAFVATSDRTIHVGPLDDCRFVAVSPDGQWLATGSHVASKGAQIWRIRDGAKVADLPVDYGTDVVFSPDGGWLTTTSAPCRLWAVGTWLEARQIGGEGRCFSPDGRLVVVVDANKVLRLVECETGRTIARLESPDLCEARAAGFSPDGARLVVTTNDGPAVHAWDLRAIRRHLAKMGLDWDASAFSEIDPADPSAPPLPPLRVDLGPLPITESLEPGFYEPVILDLERALANNPNQPSIRRRLVWHCNHFAWTLANAPKSRRNPARAVTLAQRSAELRPNEACYLNTLGVAQYRAGRNADAVATLERSLAVNRGGFTAYDLFFLAMAHHRLGNRVEARECFDRAVRTANEQKNLDEVYIHELAGFRAEAEDLLESPPPELPARPFAPETPDRP